ncbi:hypothetical protein [Chondromyces crocatus]|uniref:RCC1-like domain-containing protein n=1 Tax=Chondromyces crocatus TaxID=52 RepID=A0A0K1EHP4_CHOCO|nr:hypothetical protein [Chondromyces crocatus]AKT40379.1 uncharacterized protein CMC5_045320 [Chondromyces crocatus]
MRRSVGLFVVGIIGVTVGVEGCGSDVERPGGEAFCVDAAAGTELPDQTPGDCAARVCDGSGGVTLVALETDAPDDGNPCTLDSCVGMTPQHTPLGDVATCYTGPAGTQDQGRCRSGTMRCDPDGTPGVCEGEVLPAVEVCDAGGEDEDCDGLVNEEGEGCACGDGFVSEGEGCDDGNTVSLDGCTSDCVKEAVLSLAMGYDHACALLHDGRVKCWGRNVQGQLGLGDTEPRGDAADEMGDALPAVDLGTGVTVVGLAAGDNHTCALLGGGSVKCWGANTSGQLGLGDTAPRGDGPGEMGDALPTVNLGTGRTALAIGGGDRHTCALLDDGSVKCWGFNTGGKLGLGDTAPRGDGPGEMGDALLAVDLGAGRTAAALSVGGSHACALLDDGSVKCWGGNGQGQLGLGDAEHRGDGAGEMGDALPAVDLGTGKTAVAVHAGHFHTCALLNDGSLKCWGGNDSGELGLGDTAHRGDAAGEMGDALPAVDLGTGKKAVALSVGVFRSCALLEDASFKCWGNNTAGALGLGDTSRRGDGPGEMGDALPAIDLGAGASTTLVVTRYTHTCARLEAGNLKCWGGNTSGQLGLGDTSARGGMPGQMGDALPAVRLYAAGW